VAGALSCLMRFAGRAIAVAYVAAVTCLGASAFWTLNEGFTWREAVALLLSFPALCIGIFAIYLLAPLAWNATDADNGGPYWPVMLVYTLIFAAMAITNVWLVCTLRKWRRVGTRPMPFR
jgi:hypothetical protein